MLLLFDRLNWAWTYAEAIKITKKGDSFNIICGPKEGDAILSRLLEKTAPIVGLAYGSNAFNVQLSEYSQEYTEGRDVLVLECAQVKMKRLLDQIAIDTLRGIEERKQKLESEQEKTEEGFFGFLESAGRNIGAVLNEAAAEPGFNIVVQQIAKKILLHEPLPLVEEGMMGMMANILDARDEMNPDVRKMLRIPCPFVALRRDWPGDADFLTAAKLLSRYLLVDCGVADRIELLEAEIQSPTQIAVHFVGTRARLHQNGELKTQVEGVLNLQT